eukprot:PhF_6_TR22507/c0_g1_i1/m.31922
MDPTAATLVSGLSQCVKHLASWRWSDVSFDIPDNVVDYLKALKSLLIREQKRVGTLRDNCIRQGSSVDGLELTRDVFMFLHKSCIVRKELLLLLEAAMCEGDQDTIGATEKRRKQLVLRHTMRLLCALTMVTGENPNINPELWDMDTKALEIGSLDDMTRLNALSCIVRSAAPLVIHRQEDPLSSEELDHVEIVLTLLKNVSSVAATSLVLDTRHGYVQVFHDSGASDFILLLLKQNNTMFIPDQELKLRWNHIMTSIANSICSVAINPKDFLPEVSPGATYQPLQYTVTPNTKPHQLMNSRSTLCSSELLVKQSVTGQTIVCRSDAAWAQRLKEMDANKVRRRVSVKHGGVAGGGGTKPNVSTARSELPSRARFVLSTFMTTFTQSCFKEWFEAMWSSVRGWSNVSDDGVEKFVEKEAAQHDNACPVEIQTFFSMLSASLSYVREHCRQTPSVFPSLKEGVLQVCWLSSVADVAIKVCHAVHLRERGRDMCVLLGFLKDFLLSIIIFKGPPDIFARCFGEGDLVEKFMKWLCAKNTAMMPSNSPYLSVLMQMTHVLCAAQRQNDPVEGELYFLLRLSNNPYNLYAYTLALRNWEFNAVETNRAIISLFYSLVQYRAHAPLLHVSLLFLYNDILHATVGKPEFEELRRFAIKMSRTIIEAVNVAGSIAIPRMLFWLGANSWGELNMDIADNTLKELKKKRNKEEKQKERKRRKTEEGSEDDSDEDEEASAEEGEDDDHASEEEPGTDTTQKNSPLKLPKDFFDQINAELRRCREEWQHGRMETTTETSLKS